MGQYDDKITYFFKKSNIRQYKEFHIYREIQKMKILNLNYA